MSSRKGAMKGDRGSQHYIKEWKMKKGASGRTFWNERVTSEDSVGSPKTP